MELSRTLLLLTNLFVLSYLAMTSLHVKHEHLIKTSECHIPYSPKKMQTIKKYTDNIKLCSADDDLISIRFDEKMQQYVLNVNDNIAQLRLGAMEEKSPLVGYNCSYRKILRVNRNTTADAPVFLSEEVAFSDGYVVPRDVEGLKAACRNELAEDLQSDTFALVQPLQTYTPLISWHRRPNVVMIGVDGVSQINFRRNMPLILKHLRMQGWFQMVGYTRVGEGALPNLMALLTGYSPHTWMNLKCGLSKIGCIKTMPLIWKRFKKKGYITAYAEGMSDLTIFNLDKSGFFKSPMDFYARPFLKQNMRRDCIGRRLNTKYIYDCCEQYLKRHANSTRPMFGIFFANSINSEQSYANDKMQVDLMEMLTKLKKTGVLSQSIVILFSDQGPMRKGKNKDFLEESLPILFFWLPPWFRVMHPEIVQSLRINSNRLTSPYDLHLTLQHLLELGERWPRVVDKLVDCPTCQTLLAPVPENRTCSDAGIGESHCPCDSYKLLNVKQIKQLSLGKLLVRSINEFLHHYNLQELCSNLTLKSVKTVQQRKDKKVSDGSTYRVQFTASPNNPRFSATTRYNHKHQVLEYINVESVSRLNHYQNDSDCMRRIRGRKFCICESRIVKGNSQSKDNAKEKQNKIKKTKKEVPKKKKVDDSLYELPDMQPEINEDIEIISV
ncbi:uncharacterized protein LOC119548269 [Drosophila subpulchrella]|uniref:uncharacterized protein LOC119548269 n=1 Tax=Drosophila subpulchrella TaxID=1486046 RepID=UPI0018A16E82|nr:uncharacterized protein LOC119548269 [Drosophila subpulchrella]